MKLIKLSSIAGISAISASSIHYLFSIGDAIALKILGYGSVLTLGAMAVVLDESFSQYFGLKDDSTIAIVGTIITFIFIGGSYRAFTLREPLEGFTLAIAIAIFWLFLLFLYIKMLINHSREGKLW